MYDAAPPRPRTTNILRSRGGCRPCRGIRRKCDEGKPACLRCERNGRQCWYHDGFQWRDSNEWAACKVKKARGEPMPHRGNTISADAFAGATSIPPGGPTATDAEGQVASEYGEDPSFQHQPGTNTSPGLLTTASSSPSRAVSEASSTTTAGRSPFPPVHCWNGWTPIYPGLLPTQLSHSERRYLAHFFSHVLGILPKNLEPMHPYLHGDEAVLYAAMATSAANLARLHGEYVLSRPEETSSVEWVPDPSHKMNAFLFAGKALSLAARDGMPDPGTLVSAQVLLSLVEAELGTFEGLRRYLGCLRTFVSQAQKTLLGSQGSRELMQAVMHHQLLQSSRLIGFLENRVSSERRRAWRQLRGSPASSSSFFQVLGWEACALGGRLCLLEAMRRSTVGPDTLRERQIRRLAHMLAPEVPQERRPEDIAREIEQTHLELDRVSDAFSRCHFPVDLFHSTDDSSALHFASHEDAMDAADYVFCRIMCDKDLVRSMPLPSGSPEMPDITHVHTWVAMLLQIASGIGVNVCTIRNVYRPGILQILAACSHACRGGVGLLDFLEAFYERDPTQVHGRENVAFPSAMAVPAFKILRSQWEMGRTILFMQSLDGCTQPSSAINAVVEWTSCSVHGLEANGDFFDEVFRDLRGGEVQVQT